MSKDSLNPGQIELFRMTSLEERRAVPGKGYSCVYDAIFTCADSGHGVYEIRAKIVGFKPGRNPNSEKYNDHQIDVLGDIDKMQLLQEANISDLEDEVHIGTAVTVSPQTVPQTPYGKTPNTIRRRTAEDDADEQAEIRRLVADHAKDRAKSPTPHYIPGSAHQRDPEFWE
ncbi:hypothetical protein EDB83DRAFT_2521730 [Lactarius deliciosus]|nr:hypothetical protein EDB83DRAFT_2521730 [Lactarius deliciosus]